MSEYHKNTRFLADSLWVMQIWSDYIMDSKTIGLFKDILRGLGRNPKEGRKKGSYDY